MYMVIDWLIMFCSEMFNDTRYNKTILELFVLISPNFIILLCKSVPISDPQGFTFPLSFLNIR